MAQTLVNLDKLEKSTSGGKILKTNATTFKPEWVTDITYDSGLTTTAGVTQLRGTLTNYQTDIMTRVLGVGDVGYDALNRYKNYYNVNIGGMGNLVVGSDTSDLAFAPTPATPFSGNGYDNSWFEQGKVMILNKSNGRGVNDPTACLYIRNQNPGTERGIYMQMFNADQVGFSNSYWGIQMYMNDNRTYGQYLEVMPFANYHTYCMRQEMRANGVVDTGNTLAGNVLPVTPASQLLINQAINKSLLAGNSIEIGVPYAMYIGQWGAGHGLTLKAYATEWDSQNSAYQTWTSNIYQSLFVVVNASPKKVPVLMWTNADSLQNGVTQILESTFLDISMAGASLSTAHAVNLTSAVQHAGNMINILHQGSGDMIKASNIGILAGNSLHLRQNGTGTANNVVIDSKGNANFGIVDFELTLAGEQHEIGIYNAGSTGWKYTAIGGTYTFLDTDTYVRINNFQSLGTFTLPDPTLDSQRGRHIYIDSEVSGSQTFTCTVANKLEDPVTFLPTTTYVQTAQTKPSWEIISTGTIWKINTFNQSV